MVQNPWPEAVERVAAVLRGAGVDARIEEFPEGTQSARDAAAAIGCELAQIVKTLVVVADGAFLLVLIPGDQRLDEQAVAAAVPAREVRVATSSEVVQATGFDPGGVAPFPQQNTSGALIESSLFHHPVVWIGAGSGRHVAGLAPSELARLAGARSVDLHGAG
ncbi:MAG TPA: YbaK/EbsC family protein [Gaiellaceae bacterium]|nr:YbaK/EbsC family protein [Gaiellaceae bacterium]